jgi:hypothetical protein
MLYAIAREFTSANPPRIHYAASQHDWEPPDGPSVLLFDSLAEAEHYLSEYVWESEARIVELPPDANIRAQLYNLAIGARIIINGHPVVRKDADTYLAGPVLGTVTTDMAARLLSSGGGDLTPPTPAVSPKGIAVSNLTKWYNALRSVTAWSGGPVWSSREAANIAGRMDRAGFDCDTVRRTMDAGDWEYMLRTARVDYSEDGRPALPMYGEL